MSDISKNIKKLRQSKGLSQAQLAERLSVTRQTVSSWERSVSYPDLGMLTKLAQVFEVDVNEVIHPGGGKRRRVRPPVPVTFRFVPLSMIFFYFLLTFGGAFGLHLFDFLGGGIAEEFIFVVYWGLLLLVGFIALCTFLISDYITDLFLCLADEEQERLSKDDGAKGKGKDGVEPEHTSSD